MTASPTTKERVQFDILQSLPSTALLSTDLTEDCAAESEQVVSRPITRHQGAAVEYAAVRTADRGRCLPAQVGREPQQPAVGVESREHTIGERGDVQQPAVQQQSGTDQPQTDGHE